MLKSTFKHKLAIGVACAFLLIIGVFQPVKSAVPMGACEKCKYWQAKVDPSVILSIDATATSKVTSTRSSRLNDEASDEDLENVLEATECLLKLKGKTSPSTFGSGTVGFNLSTLYPSPSVEIAALYYISYLYHKNWRHAQAMVLMDNVRRKNRKSSIKAAYRAYQLWFKKIKEIGIEKAREQSLDPLDGTDVSWY